MFEVRTKSPVDARFIARDKEIEVAAGRISDASGAGLDGPVRERDHLWMVETIEEAIAMKNRLEAVEGVEATFHEALNG